MDGERLDALLYPLQKRLVVPIGEVNQADRNGIVAGLTRYPAIDIPAGFSKSSETAPLGIPVGMDLLGALGARENSLDMLLPSSKQPSAGRPQALCRSNPVSTPSRLNSRRCRSGRAQIQAEFVGCRR